MIRANPNAEKQILPQRRKDAKGRTDFFRNLRSLNFASLRLCGNKSETEKDLAKRAKDAKFGE